MSQENAFTGHIREGHDRRIRLDEVEQEIDEEVYRIYGIGEEDRVAIENELAEREPDDSDETPTSEEDPNDFDGELGTTLTKADLARQWISYAVGIVIGRFEPGEENGLGRGDFTNAVGAKLRAISDKDGMLVMDEGHAEDLPAKVLEALNIMFGEKQAEQIVKAATEKEGNAEDLLRHYLERQLFKLHIQRYRKRPVYWLLQSPKKKYGIWVFHEKLNKDSLFRMDLPEEEP